MDDRRAESALRDIDALFRLGVVTGVSDGQLLERFTARADREGQLAFEAIVRRHGPMVLGVCRRVLGDEQSAEDAFQATFMVLAIKAPAVRRRDSLGSWLHGVAARVARRALATRRRQQPQPLPEADLIATAAPDPALADLAAVIDEELGRLPDKYRLPVVLCYLEGRTQEEAARTLVWTKGTVSGRLARAKDLLRHRLTRRGLASSVGLVAAALTPETASAAVPASLLVATVRIATAAVLGGAEAGVIAGSVSSLVRAAMTWMRVARLVKVTALTLVVGLAAPATMAGSRRDRAGQGAGVFDRWYSRPRLRRHPRAQGVRCRDGAGAAGRPAPVCADATTPARPHDRGRPSHREIGSWPCGRPAPSTWPTWLPSRSGSRGRASR